MSEQILIEKIKQKDESIIIDLYNGYKDAFFRFLQRDFSSLDEDNLQDLYQEAWYAVYRNIKDGRLLQLTSTLKTYLFQIGRNQANTLVKKLNKTNGDEPIVEIHDPEPFPPEDIESQKANIVRSAIDELTEICRKIMKLFYYEKKKLDEILFILEDFSSKDALKTKKYKCMKRLEKIVKDKFLKGKIHLYDE